MNEEQATRLAGDIVETWTLTSSKRIWRDELLTWTDHPAAARAYTHLRRHRTGRDMDIAAFGAEYQRQKRIGADDPTDPITGCHHCADGWLDVEYDVDERHYTGVVPCECRDGRRNARLWRQIIDQRTERRGTADEPAAPPAELLNDHTLFATPHDDDTEPDPDYHPAELEESTP